MTLATSIAVLSTSAQLNVDINLVALNEDTLEVWLRPMVDVDGAALGDIIFTVRWDATYAAHIIGGPDQFSEPSMLCSFMNAPASNNGGEGEILDGGYRYYTVTGFTGATPIGGSCQWQSNVEFLYCRLPIQVDSGCVNFQIAEDAYTLSANKDFHVSIPLIGEDTSLFTYGPGALDIGDCSTDLSTNPDQGYPVLFPVPASEILNVTGCIVTDSWSVIDTEGRVVRIGGPTASDRLSIDVRPLPPGTYALRLVTDQGIRTERFTVAR